MLATLVGLTVGTEGCGRRDAGRTQASGPDQTGTPVDEPPPGFATLMLGAADPAPPASGTGESAPTGVVWYRLQDPGATAAAGSELEWYVRADHLQPGRAYRVDLTVDGHSIYSVGNGRADGTGRVTAHGLLARFTDQYCVSTPTLPQRLTGPHQIAFAVKSDGAGSGSASAGSPLTDPARELPCDGNGDGIFAYWLVTRTPASIGGPRP